MSLQKKQDNTMSSSRAENDDILIFRNGISQGLGNFSPLVIILKLNTCIISSASTFIEWYVRCTFKTFISPSLLKQLKCMSQFCTETTNEKNQFTKWETWIFNAILDQTKL